jgi:CRISPR-associated exonuclease Cas4
MASVTDDPAAADDYPPLSSLNHLLFCPRRAALLRTEQVWIDNAFTVEGTLRHRRTHDEGASQNLAAGPIARGMDLVSHRLRLVGKADVVEFRPNSAGGPPTPFPIEYKRGRKRRWDNDEVQLCAQALCLEEMTGAAVPAGAIFHIKSQRRREVAFDVALRGRTEAAAAELHRLLMAGEIPPPVVKPRCRGCSLHDVCLPQIGAQPRRTAKYLAGLFRPAEE